MAKPKNKFVMYVNTAEMAPKAAWRYLKKVRRETKSLRGKNEQWAYIAVRDNSPTRIETLYVG